ncbi:MAG: hypothetical protein QS748_02000 [Candidatus Endonucleobacter bathymodioli]|uniref:Uncharacterized protein n=1 Tax=Candidatus Endonucleibacter bathymodioli TaxID=539814 RepID=A0AA90SWV0_9GAMM|nr:hypothetical protein [Candidatus Endonucleobacter bathymodioli]
MKLLKTILSFYCIVFSLHSFAENTRVIAIYVSNHNIYLTYGDPQEKERIVSVQGGTSNSPMLSKDVASWATNDSPPAVLTVILQSLKDTDEFRRIKDDLKSKKPENVEVLIAAAGHNDTDILNREAVRKLLGGNKILYGELSENPDIKILLDKEGLTKSEGHTELFRLIMSEQFSFEFERGKVRSRPDSDFMTFVAQNGLLPVEDGLWITTYAIVHSNNNDGRRQELHGTLPTPMKERGLGGMFQLGKVAVTSNILPAIIMAYAAYHETYQLKNKLGDPALTPADTVKRLTERKLGYVNFGEFISELHCSGSLSTNSARDPIHALALGGAQNKISSISAEYSEKKVGAFYKSTIETVKADAITKFLHAMWKSGKTLKNGCLGILVGEYSDVLFGGEKTISLGKYLNNDDFVDRFIKGFGDSNLKITSLDGIDKQREAVRSYFNDGDGYLSVIPQKDLLGMLHRYGSSCIKF